jgi:hypothetical protein
MTWWSFGCVAIAALLFLLQAVFKELAPHWSRFVAGGLALLSVGVILQFMLAPTIGAGH